jgi:hypothetical protein
MASSVDNQIHSLFNLPSGDLAVGGSFRNIDDLESSCLAVYTLGDSVPVITRQPEDRRWCDPGDVAFEVGVNAIGPVSFSWRRDGISMDRTQNPTAGTSRLVLGTVAPGDGAIYDCVVTAACGEVVSAGVRAAACAGDFNCDAFVDFFDYAEFVACFEGAFCGAVRTPDFNADGFVDFFDYADFVAAFEAGC